jgi:ribosomal protein L11 methyltransferase
MPYRIDVSSHPHDALDQLVQLGALDIEPVNGGFAAIIPDAVTPEDVAIALGVTNVTVSPAVARDNGSVWLLTPDALRVGTILIAPPHADAPSGALRLADSSAFGTGRHPTTALCVEALEETFGNAIPDSILDVGTGSGVLALAALVMGVSRAVGLDIDANALEAASANAKLNGMADRLQLVHGEPSVLRGIWPLVIANVLAAPLIEMAPVLVRRVGSAGRLILSGIAVSLEPEVRQAYQRLGMRHIRSEARAGWTVVVVEASW